MDLNSGLDVIQTSGLGWTFTSVFTLGLNNIYKTLSPKMDLNSGLDMIRTCGLGWTFTSVFTLGLDDILMPP